MPEEKPQIPPPRFAVREFTTPNFADGFYSEVFKRTDPAYMALQVPKRGTLYASIIGASQQVIAQFPRLYFLKESRLGTSHEFVVWLWGTDPAAEDTYNAEVSYALQTFTAPTFSRLYNIRRDVYDATPNPLAIGSPLSGVTGATVTGGGAAYTAATTLAFSGGGGTGAAATPIISNGVIVSAVITNEGQGYTSAPTLTASDAGGGSGATFTTAIQPQGAVLVAQKKMELPEDHPLRNEYVRVIRSYMTLPGPTANSTQIDFDGMPLNAATTAQALPIASSESLTSSNTVWNKTSKKETDSTFWAYQSVESRTVPGFWVAADPEEDPLDGAPLAVFKRLQVSDAILRGEGEVPDPSDALTIDSIASGGAVTNGFLATIVTTAPHGLAQDGWVQLLDSDSTPTLPVEAQVYSVTDATTFSVFVRTDIASAGTTGSATPLWPRTTRDPYQSSTLVALEVVKLRTLPGPPRYDKYPDTDRIIVSITDTVKGALTITPVETFVAPDWSETKQKKIPGTSKIAFEEITTRTLPGNIVTEQIPFGETGIPILVSEQLVSSDVIFQTGEFQPAAINVQGIGVGTPCVVNLVSDPGLPVGAYVRFAGTNSTPPIDGVRQILALGAPGSVSLIVTPPSIVTASGTAAGTMQAVNQISRRIEKTEHSKIKKKVDTMIAVPDVSVFNENVLCTQDYPFPDFLREINFYRDQAVSTNNPGMGGNPNSSQSWTGSVGFDIQAGYRGPCTAHRLTLYFSGPPPDSFKNNYSETIIIPSAGTFVVEGGSSATSGFPTLYDQISVSNSYRAGVIPPVIWPGGEVNTIEGNAGALTVTGITTNAGGSGGLVVVTTSVNHGLTAGMNVVFSGTNSTPPLTGPYEVGGSSALNNLQLLSPTVTGAGSTGSMRISAATPFGGGVATCNLNLTASVPPIIVGELTITAIGTGASPTLTLSAPHYLNIGQRIKITGANGTPPIPDGVYRIMGVTGTSSQLQITPPAPITVAGNTGTLQNIITLIDQPQKLDSVALWRCIVRLVEVPYTSGQVP